jgi:hypothetical protein
LADLDGDGRIDLVSGCYRPGRVYVFAGDGKGGFAKSTTLNFKDGTPLSVGAAMHVAVADWDRDGDLDLVIGNIKGDVFFVPNEGTAKAPAWGKATPITAPAADDAKSGALGALERSFGDGEKAAAVAGGSGGSGSAGGIRVEGDAGPIVADWDGDGVPDLLVGSGDGSVRWYRNTTKSGAPTLAAPQMLVAAAKDGADAARSGMRSKVEVVDWNGDGRADLLVGDFSSKEGDEPKLSAEQVVERDRLRAERDAVDEKMQPIFQKAMEAANKAAGVEDGQLTDEQADRWSEAHDAALKADPAYAELQAKMAAIFKKLGSLEARHEAHGNVWVHLRKAAAK